MRGHCTRRSVAPNAMLRIVSMQPGHADALHHTALIQTVPCAIDSIVIRYAKECT